MAYHAPLMSAPIYLLNGPNLDLLGEREPELYGRDTLADIEQRCRTIAQRHGLELIAHQSNAEHEIIHWLHQARSAAGIVHNPGGFSYYSVAILDALRICKCPIIEVHISNLFRREEDWRRRSLLASGATGIISGLGVDGYRLAMEYLIAKLAPPASSAAAKG
jgi:3-dehydroquinate dehydratase II